MAAPFKDKVTQPGWLKAHLRRKANRRRLVRTSLIAGNLLIFAAAAYLVIGQPYRNKTMVITSPILNSAAPSGLAPSALDHLASASIARTAAQMTGVAEVIPITNQADSEVAKLSQAATTDDTLSSKPQIVATAFKSNKDIKLYTVHKGDTISSIANQFDVTSDSIRWSNNITGNIVPAGRKLRIPPVNGIVYKVSKGDTIASLASKYSISADKLTEYNDAEIGGLKIGTLIILPDASRAAQVVRSARPAFSGSFYGGNATYGYNGYDLGYCTWWVAVLRQKAGNSLPANLGNASTWAIRAAAFGLPTGTTPRVGAAVVTSTSGEGHVGYVTAVHSDGSITISEMNHDGWNRTDSRRLSGHFSYIY